MQSKLKSAPNLNLDVPPAEDDFNSQTLARIFADIDSKVPVAVALSGGGDSMALLHLLLKWRGCKDIFALTVDHNLRENSATEAAQVKSWCAELEVQHQTIQWQHAPILTGLQAKARQARYDLMTKWCQENNVPILLTAHNIEDQAETVAMRTLRTKSPKSLAGIWPETVWRSIKIMRPLLAISRDALRKYLQEKNQKWLEDPSNKNEKFERVRIRSQSPSLDFATAAKHAQCETIKAQSLARDWLQTNFELSNFGMGKMSLQGFARLEEEAQDSAICQIIKSCCGTMPERTTRQNLNHWLTIATSPRFTCSALIFARRKNYFLIGREPARITPSKYVLSPTKPKLWDQRFEIWGPEGSTVAFLETPKPRIKNIPAFITQGLPTIVLHGKVIANCFESHHPEAKIRFTTK